MKENIAIFSIITLILGILFCTGCGKPCFTDHDYITAIVGEASNQSEGTMVCIAHALRNRGTLKGVYGFNAFHVFNEPKAVWRKATIAWDLSAHEPDFLHGVKNFGTLRDLRKEGDVKIFAQCGDFYFY